jgi:hypothetical protein
VKGGSATAAGRCQRGYGVNRRVVALWRIAGAIGQSTEGIRRSTTTAARSAAFQIADDLLDVEATPRPLAGR